MSTPSKITTQFTWRKLLPPHFGPKSPSDWALTILGFGIAFTVWFAIFVLYQTVTASTPPVTFGDTRARAWNAEGQLIISYNRPTIVHKNATVTINRSVDCFHVDHIQTFDLQPLLRDFKAGKPQNVNRLVTYPEPQPVGTKCRLSTMISWYPFMSMYPHTKELAKLDFEVDESPRSTNEGTRPNTSAPAITEK